MGLNITAERRVDISGYGEGWDGCYLLVKTMNPKELDDWYKTTDSDDNTIANLDRIYGELLKKQLAGGVILNTNPDGSKEMYAIEASDISDLVDQLQTMQKQDALFVAAGTNGLKGL